MTLLRYTIFLVLNIGLFIQTIVLKRGSKLNYFNYSNYYSGRIKLAKGLHAARGLQV